VPLVTKNLSSELVVDFFNFEVYSGFFFVLSDLGLVQKSLKNLLENTSMSSILSVNNQILSRVVLLILCIVPTYFLFRDIVVIFGLINAIFLSLLSPWIYHSIGGYFKFALLPVLLKALLLIMALITGEFYFFVYLGIAIVLSTYLYLRRVSFHLPRLEWDIEVDNIKITSSDILTWLYSSSPILILQKLNLPLEDVVAFGLVNKLSKSIKAFIKPIITAFLGNLKSIEKVDIWKIISFVSLGVYISLELFFIEDLGLLLFGDIASTSWYIRATLFLSVIGSVNVLIGFGYSITQGDFNIKLRQAVLGSFIFLSLASLLLLKASVLVMLLILVLVEIVILIDYAKKSVAFRRFNA
jgi:hypothetical protein